MPERKRRLRRWFPVWCQALGNMIVYHFHRYAVGAYIILVLALVLALGKVQTVSHQAHRLAVANQQLAIENQRRIEEIQDSRLRGCERTFESFRLVFKPFIRPAKLQTPIEKKNLAKFNAVIDRLKGKCAKLVKPKPNPKPVQP